MVLVLGAWWGDMRGSKVRLNTYVLITQIYIQVFELSKLAWTLVKKELLICREILRCWVEVK